MKLIDFGFARSFKTGLKTICGTPLYVAPVGPRRFWMWQAVKSTLKKEDVRGEERLNCQEVFSGHYTSKCDLWSCGMTLFHMLTASPPFTGDLQQILRAARRGLEPQALARLASEEAKEVVASLCSVCPLGRPSACSLLQGQWLLKREREVPREEIAENLQHYSEMHPVKKAVLKTIVHVIEDKDIQCLREAFESLDTHGEGSIPVDTLHSTIASSTRSTEADSICGHLEKMDYSNWLSANVQPQQYLKEGDSEKGNTWSASKRPFSAPLKPLFPSAEAMFGRPSAFWTRTVVGRSPSRSFSNSRRACRRTANTCWRSSTSGSPRDFRSFVMKSYQIMTPKGSFPCARAQNRWIFQHFQLNYAGMGMVRSISRSSWTC